MNKVNRHSVKKWAWIAVACILFGPFAIIYFLAFLGLPLPEGSIFGIWFMGSLTISGIIATVDSTESVRQHGLGELGCVLPLAAFPCFIGYSFLEMIGVVG